MIVLVITMVVIIILGSVSISALSASRQKTDIINFIFDLNTMDDKVQNYYVENGTLPTVAKEPLDIKEFANKLAEPEVFLSQLSPYDNENYYIVDLSQLKGVSLRKSFRGIPALKAANQKDNGYIVNEGSLKVYVEEGVKYKIPGDKEGTTFYTLTSELVNGQEYYVSQEEDVVVVGNPMTWSKEATLRVVLPKQSLVQTVWDGWTFKWDFGPKTQKEMEEIESDDVARNFEYGDKLLVKSNGTYTIYIKNPETGKVTLRNVNVSKIDDRPPTFNFSDAGSRINALDSETGIKEIKFKKLSEYKANVAQAIEEAETGGDVHSDSRTKVDYYLMDGKGHDLMYEFETLMVDYLNARSKIQLDIDNENDDYERWVEEHPVDGVTVLQSEADNKLSTHDAYIAEFNRQLAELDNKYSYFYDIKGKTDDSRIVIYIEDYSGNATVVGDEHFISMEILAVSYNLPIDTVKNYFHDNG